MIKIVDSIYKINKFDDISNIDELKVINLAKNEYRSFSLVINEKTKIEKLNIMIESKNKYNIFYEYYHEIKKTSTVFSKKGYYPDCLIAYDNFVSLNMLNKTNKDENIVFLIDFIGLYSDDIKINVNINDKNYTLNLKIELNDFDLKFDQEIYAKTLFGIFPEMIDNNKYSSVKEYLTCYNDILNRYLISSNRLNNDISDILNLIEEIKEKTLDNKVSVISLPLLIKDNKCDISYLKEMLKLLIVESNKDNINYLKKIICYNYVLDEPEEDKFSEVEKFYNDFKNLKLELKDLLLNEDYKDTLINISNITTVFFRQDLYNKIDTWSPTFIAMQMSELEYEKEKLEENGDKIWWYGCVWPMHPYPNYHLDDDLLNIVVLNYMQFYYGILGNLYWGVNINKKYNLDKKVYEDANVFNDAMLFPPANGDGYLTYEGTYFNIDDILPTLRLNSIREGICDYQYLIILEKELERLHLKYNKKYNRKKYFSLLFEDLFYQAIVKRNYDAFFKVKNLIKELLDLANKDILVLFDYEYLTIIENNNEIKTKNHNLSFNIKELTYILNESKYYSLGHNDNFILNCDLNLEQFNNVNFEIDNKSSNCFCLELYAVNELDNKLLIGYQIIKENSLDIYKIDINYEFTSKYTDIESTAFCNHYLEYKDEIINFRKHKIKNIEFVVKNYKTFADKEDRINDTYNFNLNKVFLR